MKKARDRDQKQRAEKKTDKRLHIEIMAVTGTDHRLEINVNERQRQQR